MRNETAEGLSFASGVCCLGRSCCGLPIVLAYSRAESYDFAGRVSRWAGGTVSNALDWSLRLATGGFAVDFFDRDVVFFYDNFQKARMTWQNN